MALDFRTNIFEGIYRVEEYLQISAILLFIFVAFLELPLNLPLFTIDGQIPNRFWIFIFMTVPVYFASGILRWVTSIGEIIGKEAERRIESWVLIEDRQKKDSSTEEQLGDQ